VKRETILVTGSSGLIGTAICAHLKARGYGVRRFDIADQRGGYSDIRVAADLDAAVTGCTGVVHLAAVSRVIWGQRDPKICHETNVIGTRTLIDRLRSSTRRPWLILGSSREVYGQARDLPVTEGHPLQPMNHYARSKLQAEQAVMQARDAGLRAAVLRFSTVYGTVADHADRVIPAFCRAAVGGHPLRVEGAMNALDITHVTDVAACIAKLADRLAEGKAFQPMHLTTGHGTTLSELAQTVVRLARSDSEILTTAPRDFDVTTFIGDPGLAEVQIGWHPQVALESGLRDLIGQFQQAQALVA